MRSLWLTTLLVLPLSAVPVAAQQPTIVHAQLRTASAAEGLSAQVEAVEHTHGPAWFGYSILTDQPFHSAVDPSDVDYLEQPERHHGYNSKYAANFDRVNLLFRVEGGQIQRLLLAEPRRVLDAGGLPFVWLSEVREEDSVHLLHAVADSVAQQSREAATLFIALHRSPSAVPALLSLASTGEDIKVRESAAFWLASSRGHAGFLAIQELLRSPDPAFRAKLTFDLTLCHEAAATTELISIAHNDPSPAVRSQAEFWMATLASKQVKGELRASAEQDADTQVRQAAVFALSRLPGEEAATELIRVAETNRNPDARRQAIFWLGQSKDPRAFDYLAQLLKAAPQSAP